MRPGMRAEIVRNRVTEALELLVRALELLGAFCDEPLELARARDEIADLALARRDAVTEQRGQLVVAPGSRDRVEQQGRRAGATQEQAAEVLEHGARVGATRLLEQRVDLDAGAGPDRIEQQVGLAPVVGVDRTGRQPRGAGGSASVRRRVVKWSRSMSPSSPSACERTLTRLVPTSFSPTTIM